MIRKRPETIAAITPVLTLAVATVSRPDGGRVSKSKAARDLLTLDGGEHGGAAGRLISRTVRS